MSVEFRPLRPDELHDAVYAEHIGFGQSIADAEIDRSIAGRVGPDFALAAFEDGVLAAQVVTLPMTIFWNGPTLACGGVTVFRGVAIVRSLPRLARVPMR